MRSDLTQHLLHHLTRYATTRPRAVDVLVFAASLIGVSTHELSARLAQLRERSHIDADRGAHVGDVTSTIRRIRRHLEAHLHD